MALHTSHKWLKCGNEIRCFRCETAVNWPLAEQKCEGLETVSKSQRVRLLEAGAEFLTTDQAAMLGPPVKKYWLKLGRIYGY